MPIYFGTPATYLENHNKFRIRIGEHVRLFRMAEDHENGWKNAWVPEMTTNIGNIGTVISNDGYEGFRIRFDEGERLSFQYPYFVLDIVR
jgi:hypothetical protein